MPEKLPVGEPEFWSERLERVRVGGLSLHKVVYDVSEEVWEDIQEEHREILSRLFDPYRTTRVLDVGCSIGELLDVLPASAEYTGVDLSPDLISLARESHPGRNFLVEDVREGLSFPDRSFDLAICRSLDGMVKEHLGVMVWRQMETEILRVADRLVTLSFGEPDLYRVCDAVSEANKSGFSSIESEGGRLVYRPGQDGTVELYDLWVSESRRRKGVASRLIRKVLAETFGCVYGFTQVWNAAIHDLYRKLGFELIRVPGFYRGVDAIMVVKTCLPGLNALMDPKKSH